MADTFRAIPVSRMAGDVTAEGIGAAQGVLDGKIRGRIVVDEKR